MKIVPSQSDLKNWCECFPTSGDLIFLDDATVKKLQVEKLQDSPFTLMTPEEVRVHTEDLWNLNHRSWYGYSLSNASHCAWLTTGQLERLPAKVQPLLAEAQINLKVPTLIKTSLVTDDISEKLLHFDQHLWLSSKAWLSLSETQKQKAVLAWHSQNEIHTYQSFSLDDLPTSVQNIAKRLGIDSVLNSFAKRSGPNCLATTSALLSSHFDKDLANHWMLGTEFIEFLKNNHFSEIQFETPLAGDVLVFSREDKVVHAAYSLGHGYYFEKPGQDFYEPYRIDKLEDWKINHSNTSMCIWRKIFS